jgi:hypothetical protein
MKTIIFIKFIIIIMVLSELSSCDLNFKPYDSLTSDAALATTDGIQTATYGTYAGIKTLYYNLYRFREGEELGDNVTVDAGFFTDYKYKQTPTWWSTVRYWPTAYSAIYDANSVIEKIKDGTSPILDQLKGENLFIRALVHFDLVVFYGRPYPQNQGDNLGIPIKDNTNDDLPSRSTVKEVYDFIIADLLKAASLMTIEKNSCFASKETAYALLSRVYLYKEDNANAIIYANKVIESGRYQLMATEPYKKYFTVVPESNPETIFAIRYTIADNQNRSAIGSLYYNDPVTQATGNGQLFASMAYVNLLDKYPQDVRHSFLVPLYLPDSTIKLVYNVPVIYVNKYNYQEGIVNLSSPVYLRLAEMYLNRAEANAKLGSDVTAIEDVNLIRQRAGLSGSALYTVNDLKGHNSVLEVVLEERRLELAFEGQRPFDLYRNNLPMVRAYPGFHGTDNYNFTVEPTDPRVVWYLPQRELIVNKNLVQNP